MNVFSIRAGLVAVALSASAASYSATIVSNLPNQVSGDNMSFAQVADNFSLGSTVNFTGIRFWSVQSAAADYSGNVYWAIHSNTAGAPGAVLFTGTPAVTAIATGGSTGFGYAEYQFDFAVAFQLLAGDYWLALHNGSLASTTPTEMFWETSSAGIASTGQYNDLTDAPDFGWIDTGNEHAFALFGERVIQPPPDVPEPGTVALLLGGLLAAASVRRATRRA